jgi:F-type H+-transporting ATPase subunit delta
MDNSQIAVRYAKSIFLLAEEKNIIEEIRNDIQLIESSFSAFPELKESIYNPIINPSVKAAILTDIFKTKLNEYTFNFLLLVLKNKRENSFVDIFRDFDDIYRKSKNIKKSVITSVKKLDKNSVDIIVKTLEKTFDTTMEIEERLNPNIIGGFIIQIEDKAYDYSIAGKLHIIDNELKRASINLVN